MSEPHISPRQFMKMRRPERFSDSVGNDLSILDRSQLEYHLDSLTSRSQELDFEQGSRITNPFGHRGETKLIHAIGSE